MVRKTLNYKGKKFEIDLKVCNWFEKFFGLMFSRRGKSKALLFDFRKFVRIGIHSWFVFFPFVAIWLDDKDKIIDLEVVRPFAFLILPKKSFYRLVEVPINEEYKKVVGILVGDRKI